MSQLPQWIDDYNAKAPHKALNMLSPREFIRKQKLAG
jgi:transposase InsO family protein